MLVKTLNSLEFLPVDGPEDLTVTQKVAVAEAILEAEDIGEGERGIRGEIPVWVSLVRLPSGVYRLVVSGRDSGF